ncbi:MAG: hypothetical protein IKF77_05255, partial [Thermoguttaceae bacterium]|nr:hypothetical protein [Thermoguttaceae bacterium]
MKRQNGPKNPGQRDRDIDKSARSPAAARPRRRNLGNDAEETHGAASPFSQTPWSTERFDASTHTDQLARTESNFGETAVLVGVYAPKAPPSSTPLAELAGLAKAAGVLPAAEL